MDGWTAPQIESAQKDVDSFANFFARPSSHWFYALLSSYRVVEEKGRGRETRDDDVHLKSPVAPTE